MKLIFLTALFLCLLFTAHAEYTQTCKVKYKKEYDIWSDYYKVDVHFMTGTELNRKTSSFDYESFETYAVIFWSDNKATVIKLSTSMMCGSEVEESCITNKYGNLEGSDKDGRPWEICVKGYCS